MKKKFQTQSNQLLNMGKNNSLINKISSDKNLDCLFITNLNNIRYLSGFTGSSAFLLLLPNKKYFLTDYRYKIQSKHEVKKDFNFVFYQKKIISEIVKLFKKYKMKRVGLEGNDINYSMAKEIVKEAKVKAVDCSKELSILRKFKSIKEIKQIKKALQCAERSFRQVAKYIRPGISEKDIAVELEYKIKKNGADDIAFPVIVASGKRSALPHAAPTGKKLKEKEFVIIDFGAKLNGYHSDITYTIDLGNKNKLLNKAYNIVKESTVLAQSLIKKDGNANIVDQKIHAFIQKNGFHEGMIHGLGHGVGLDIHELPVLSRNKKDTFKEGMVFTIEPGIYLENIGGVRIELMAYISKQGLKILNTSHINC